MANTIGGQGNGQEQAGRNVQSSMMDEGERLASQAAEKAREVHGRVAEKGEEALGTVGEKMSSLAGTIRQRAPKEGRMGSAAEAVADTLESSGQYLSDHGVSDIAQDVTSIVRRYPMQSLWVGLGLGFLVGSLAGSKR